MIIKEFKFNIGDKVWWVGEGKIENSHVSEIIFRRNSSKQDATYYDVYYPSATKRILEEHLFPTKEDLIASL